MVTTESASQIDVRESQEVECREILWSTMTIFNNTTDFTFENFSILDCMFMAH